MQTIVSHIQLLNKRLENDPSNDPRCCGTKVSLKQEISDQINKFSQELDELRDKYYAVDDEKEVVNAYVTFRSNEGFFRVLHAYNNKFTWCGLCCLRCCKKGNPDCYKCCCKMYYKDYDRLLIGEKWPKVTKAADPSVILWQNMGISRRESNMRTLLISIVTLVLLIICAVINLFGANADKELAEIAPPAQCDSSIKFTVEEA